MLTEKALIFGFNQVQIRAFFQVAIMSFYTLDGNSSLLLLFLTHSPPNA
jgi:hypothetical protein